MPKRKFLFLFLSVILFFTIAAEAQDFDKIADVNFLSAKGQSFYEKGSYQEAIRMLDEAVKIRPEDAKATYYLALSYQKIGKEDAALDLLDSYLDYTKETDKWLGSIDREFIAKCAELAKEIRAKIKEE